MHFTDVCAKNILFLHNYALKVQKKFAHTHFFLYLCTQICV